MSVTDVCFRPIADIGLMSDVVSMGYTGRTNSAFPLGCFPATFFGFVVGAPYGFVIVMSECIGDSGQIGSCPNEGVELLAPFRRDRGAVLYHHVGYKSDDCCSEYTWQVIGLGTRRWVPLGSRARWGAIYGCLALA